MGDSFGLSVALRADGNTLAVGAWHEDSGATGINGIQGDNSATDAGAVYIFARVNNTWSQQAYVKASNSGDADEFGYRIGLSAEGDTLVVSADREASGAKGIGGPQGDNSAKDAGAVYVFVRTNDAWLQQAYIKASNSGAGDFFGQAVALSTDGNTLAVGAYGEDSQAKGIDGTQDDNSTTSAGAVYLFVRENDVWSQKAYVKASNPDVGDQFGVGVALSGDSFTLLVGANTEDSAAIDIGGNQSNNSAVNAGAVYFF